MPDDNKPITNTGLPGTSTQPGASSIPPPISPSSAQDQATSAPPPSMQDGLVSPPPPIVEEEKPEETAASGGVSVEESPAAPSIPPVMTTSGAGGKKFGGKKVIATILGVLVLVGGIGAGVVLVQRQQDIREKAGYMTGACRECEGGKCVQRLTPPNCNPAENECTYDSDCVETPPTDGGDTGGTDTGGGSKKSTTKPCASAGGECVTTTATACLTIGRERVDGSCPSGQLCCQVSNTCASRGGECVFAAGNCSTLGRENIVNGSCPTGYNCCKPANPCTGECIATNAGSCYALGKESAGGDCALGQICCKESSSSSSEGEACTNSVKCGFQKLCISGTCQTKTFCDSNSCDVGDYYSESCYVNHYHTDDADDPTVNDVILKQAVKSSKLGLKDCGAEQIDVTCKGNRYVDGVWVRYDKDCTPKSTPSPGLDCQCLDIKVFDEEWSQLSVGQLIALEAGNVVRFTVSGVSSAGAIDKARFTINGVQRPEVTAKRPGTNEYYDEYTIPEGVSSFTINAELHHTTIGWF